MIENDKQISVFGKVLMTLKYQFQPGFLIYMLVLALAGALVPLMGGFAMFVMVIAALALMYKSYDSAFCIVEGDDETVSYALAPNIKFTTPLKLMLVYFVISLVLGFVLSFFMRGALTASAMVAGGGLPTSVIVMNFLLNAFFVIINPAITMLMIQTQSFRQTINPSNWFGFMNAMGLPRYFLMVAILFVVAFVLGLLAMTAALLQNVIGFALMMFFMAVAIGFQFLYVAYCSREDYVDNGQDLGISKEANNDLRMANQAWQAGNREDAVQSLLLTINNTSDWQQKMPLLTRLFEYYDEMGQSQKKEQWISQMIHQVATKEHENFPQIHGFVKDKVAQAEAFQPQLIYPLANLALINRDAELAVKLTTGFAKKHPNHVDIPGNYFVAAKALKTLRKSEQAYKILAHLIKTYPNDEEMPEIKALFSEVKTKLKAKQALAKARAEKADKT